MQLKIGSTKPPLRRRITVKWWCIYCIIHSRAGRMQIGRFKRAKFIFSTLCTNVCGRAWNASGSCYLHYLRGTELFYKQNGCHLSTCSIDWIFMVLYVSLLLQLFSWKSQLYQSKWLRDEIQDKHKRYFMNPLWKHSMGSILQFLALLRMNSARNCRWWDRANLYILDQDSEAWCMEHLFSHPFWRVFSDKWLGSSLIVCLRCYFLITE